MLKKRITIMTVAICGLISVNAYAGSWLSGVYVNQDSSSMMDEVIFCDAGKAYAGMAHRSYQMQEKDGHEYLVLNSNGKFTFKVSGDKTELLPADDFTREWFTKDRLRLDPNRKDTCNW